MKTSEYLIPALLHQHQLRPPSVFPSSLSLVKSLVFDEYVLLLVFVYFYCGKASNGKKWLVLLLELLEFMIVIEKNVTFLHKKGRNYGLPYPTPCSCLDGAIFHHTYLSCIQN